IRRERATLILESAHEESCTVSERTRPVTWRGVQNGTERTCLVRHAVGTMDPMTDITLRNESLRQLLCDWRLSLNNEVESRVRRSREAQNHDGQDVIEQADAGAQAEMQLAVLEMRA